MGRRPVKRAALAAERKGVETQLALGFPCSAAHPACSNLVFQHIQAPQPQRVSASPCSVQLLQVAKGELRGALRKELLAAEGGDATRAFSHASPGNFAGPASASTADFRRCVSAIQVRWQLFRLAKHGTGVFVPLDPQTAERNLPTVIPGQG